MQGLKEIRTTHQKRFTIVEVARFMGVSVPTYRKWEENPETMTMQQARKLADYLGCEVGDLFSMPREVK